MCTCVPYISDVNKHVGIKLTIHSISGFSSHFIRQEKKYIENVCFRFNFSVVQSSIVPFESWSVSLVPNEHIVILLKKTGKPGK